MSIRLWYRLGISSAPLRTSNQSERRPRSCARGSGRDRFPVVRAQSDWSTALETESIGRWCRSHAPASIRRTRGCRPIRRCRRYLRLMDRTLRVWFHALEEIASDGLASAEVLIWSIDTSQRCLRGIIVPDSRADWLLLRSVGLTARHHRNPCDDSRGTLSPGRPTRISLRACSREDVAAWRKGARRRYKNCLAAETENV